MKFDLDDLTRLEQIISNASDEILTPFINNTTAQRKSDGSIVTEADIQMQNTLHKELANFAPEVTLLGEEMEASAQQRIIDSSDAYWCLDPLDGTNNFHHGVPLFSVSVALVSEQKIKAGLVYDPVRKEMFSALAGHGLRINGVAHEKSEQPQRLGDCLASVDFKRLEVFRREHLVRHTPFKSQRNAGSCALEWAWLAAGRLQLLLHGGEKLWDYAAGVLLNAEAGGISCGFARESIFNNSLESRPVLAASTATLHRAWADFLLSDPN
jgi:myo-inositol-1(or 4)-monophosphatase